MTAGRIGGAAAVSLLLLSGAVGCAGSGSSAGGGSVGANAIGAVAGTTTHNGGATKRAAAATGAYGSVVGSPALLGPVDSRSVISPAGHEPGLPPQRSTVIKTARLALRVKKGGFPEAIAAANRLASGLGGTVLSTDQSGGSTPTAMIVIRVPAASFNEALGKLRTLDGGKMRALSVNGEEVGQEFVDLGARQSNLQAQENVLRRLMNRAISISDTIRVENELSQVQGQIEQIAGRLRYLHDQADLSTITVSLTQPGGPGAAATSKPGALHRAFSRAWSGTVSVVSGVIVGAGVVLPIAILLVIAAAIGLRVWPPLRRRLTAQPAATAPTGE
jgi:Domain of unknown function (DUF4349)